MTEFENILICLLIPIAYIVIYIAGKYDLLENVCYMLEKAFGKTNGNKIRNMTDEELAEYLVNFKNTFGEEYEGEMSCLDWLKSEVESDAE